MLITGWGALVQFGLMRGWLGLISVGLPRRITRVSLRKEISGAENKSGSIGGTGFYCLADEVLEKI